MITSPIGRSCAAARLVRVIVFAAALALVFSACGSDDNASRDRSSTSSVGASTSSDASTGGDTAESTPPSSERGNELESSLTVLVANSAGGLSTSGAQRVLTALVGDGPNSYFGGPDEPVALRFESVDGDTVGEVEGTWLTTNASALGLYVSYYQFDAPGLWEVTAFGDGENLGTTLIQVVEESAIPNIGDPAPQSATLTGTTPQEIAAISTDAVPDPSFYDLTIADAVTNGRPTVVAFVTPAFCQTALCGPTLETVKAATAGRDDIDVVHVEPFDLTLAPQGELQAIPAMLEWGVATEPWVFVMDAGGTVSASFEGILGQAELEAALAAL